MPAVKKHRDPKQQRSSRSDGEVTRARIIDIAGRLFARASPARGAGWGLTLPETGVVLEYLSTYGRPATLTAGDGRLEIRREDDG